MIIKYINDIINLLTEKPLTGYGLWVFDLNVTENDLRLTDFRR